jgi:Xaa-Pro aminopeptidase
MAELSFAERDRRYTAVLNSMKEMGLDALLVICDAQIEKKGFLKYLTNYRNVLYNLVAIFPLNGEAKLLVPSQVQVFWASRLSWINNVELEAPNLNECLVRNIKEMGFARSKVGLCSPKIMPADTYNYLIANLPEMELVNATTIIESLRMVKSEEELNNMRETAALADYSFEVVANVLRPGMTERELLAAVDQKLIERGAQDIFHLIQSEPGDLMPFQPKNRRMQKGESVIINNELSGPSGYWAQMVRTAFIGEPTGRTGQMYDELLTIMKKTAVPTDTGDKSARHSRLG